MFPELLYILSQRDQQVTWLDPILQRSEESSLNAVIFEEIVFPTDRAVLLHHAHAGFSPGAAQNISTGELNIRRVLDGAFIRLRLQGDALAVNIDLEQSWQGEILLPPGWSVRATGIFSAAAAANLVQVSVAAVVIPAGNIQRV